MSRSLFAAAAAVFLLAACSTVVQAQGTNPKPPAWLVTTLQVWSDRDASAAFGHLEASGSAQVVAERYILIARHVFNQRRSLPETILAARAGIDFCLHHANAPESTADASTQLRGHAKTLAYDLGANCWPGFGEPDITIGPTEQAIGRDAAHLNLRLAKELKRPAEPMANAHWLLGAHQVAAGAFDEAAAEFERSAKLFAEARKPTEQQMAQCYEHLTRVLQHPGQANHRAALDKSLAALQSLRDENAGFYAEQILTAHKALGK